MCSFTILNNWSQWEMGVLGTICNKGNGSNRYKKQIHWAHIINPQLGMYTENWKMKIGINWNHLSFLRLQSLYTNDHYN